MNSKIVSEPTGEQMTLFSPVGSLNYASHTPLQENDLEKKMTATSGRKCLDVFEKFNRNTLWAKTYSELLIGTGGWFSTKCNLTWKLKATKYKRMYFQLAPSTPRTDETEFGLWLTPQATERHRTDIAEQMREEGKPLYFRRTKDGKSRQFSPLDYAAYKGMLPTLRASKISGTDREDFTPSLPGLMNKGLLPTPQARDEKNGSKLEDGRTQRKIEQGWSMGLNDLSTMGLLPTPVASECRDSQLTPEQAKTLDKGGRVLRRMGTLGVLGDGKDSLQLNPQFVGEMMGFLPNHTVLPYQKIETTWTEI